MLGAATFSAMNRKHLKGALLIAAASLLATGAYAQSTPKAADTKAEKATDKGDKGEKKADKAEERTARKAKEHDAQREKLKVMLKAPPNDLLKQELRLHAEHVARIERIKSVAQTEKDNATVEKATALLSKENERHEKALTKLTTTTGEVK